MIKHFTFYPDHSENQNSGEIHCEGKIFAVQILNLEGWYYNDITKIYKCSLDISSHESDADRNILIFMNWETDTECFININNKHFQEFYDFCYGTKIPLSKELAVKLNIEKLLVRHDTSRKLAVAYQCNNDDLSEYLIKVMLENMQCASYDDDYDDCNQDCKNCDENCNYRP